MTPYKQLISGPFGDCVRTCIASILNVEPATVPHFFIEGIDGPAGWNKAIDWLNHYGDGALWRSRGLFFLGLPGDYSVNDVLAHVGRPNPEAYYMLCGTGENRGNHCVVCKGEEIVHDPSWGGNGIIGPGEPGHYLVIIIT